MRLGGCLLCTLIVIAIMIGWSIYIIYEIEPKNRTETILPEIKKDVCLTWDEAKQEYQSDRLVLTYALEPCGID